jgi:hypothetical protein
MKPQPLGLALLHRMSPEVADFVAKVPKYQATIFSKTKKLN